MATFILIPGAGGLAWYWHRVVPALQTLGHEAIAIQLPAGDDSAGLAEYAGVVVDSIGTRSGVVLVAQSMGGLTAPLVCDRVDVSLLVLLNAMVPTSGESGGDWWANTGQASAYQAAAHRDGRGPDADPFFHDVPADIVAEATREELVQSTTPFDKPWPLDRWPDVPTRVLLSRDDRLFPADFQRRVARERLGIVPDEMAGGHLVALSRPDELAARLADYSVAAADRL